jgi:hypothetical protein
MTKVKKTTKKLYESGFNQGVEYPYSDHGDVDWDTVFDGDIEEADKPTMTATDIDWDSLFDEPVSHSVPSTSTRQSAIDAAGSAKVEPDIRTSDLKRGSAADTARAVGNITPSDSMRDMMSRINVPADMDAGDDDTTDIVPHRPIEPQNVPAVISREIAMSDPHAVNPTWHAVSNLPGNMSRAILTLGRALFKAFTRTPTEDIVMIGNVGGQGPNSTREVNSVAAWVKENGRPVDSAKIDFDQTIPGYSASVKHYVVGGVRFKIVKDQFGDYIYAWPETDSLDTVQQIGGAGPTGRLPSR